jgi:hypothetical protein
VIRTAQEGSSKTLDFSDTAFPFPWESWGRNSLAASRQDSGMTRQFPTCSLSETGQRQQWWRSIAIERRSPNLQYLETWLRAGWH